MRFAASECPKQVAVLVRGELRSHYNTIRGKLSPPIGIVSNHKNRPVSFGSMPNDHLIVRHFHDLALFHRFRRAESDRTGTVCHRRGKPKAATGSSFEVASLRRTPLGSPASRIKTHELQVLARPAGGEKVSPGDAGYRYAGSISSCETTDRVICRDERRRTRRSRQRLPDSRGGDHRTRIARVTGPHRPEEKPPRPPGVNCGGPGPCC